ncbi:ABC transporter substrate-binding protein [Bradyrhizobium manausense]|uniref:ABC transporter substrate-binding protein n=1 Tax=Bradyrhizobium TaxID=374 RepID=UPI001BA85F7E|nr:MULTISPECIES: ABC transporter substrate-binding protein [Bradyrhizobium]MBR0826551.1 ABC transporter substrate-binding protein [Bradyrhizobium manausense]UVO28944.1 ABC transporter substrate-binding protein [Bradyrhizobium arachidis]
MTCWPRGIAAAAILGLGAISLIDVAARAEPGVYDDRILFGQSAAFEGPAAALGLGMREGILASFNEANATGGVNGRRLELVSYDDGYEPEKAIANTKRLIDENGVFALVGEVGTPTSNAAQPITTEAGVPFIGPFTGAAFLRNPSLRNVINIRGSYDQETEAWIEHLTADLGVSRIAILYQDDTFGRAGLSGVSKAMEKRGMKLVAEGTFERNTIAVKTALLAIRKAGPEAVVMVGPYKPCAEFIKLAHRLKLDAVFVNISFVGANALAKELGEDGKGVVVTQVVPFPGDTSIPLVARYQKALKIANPDAQIGFVSLEGYMVGRLVIEALGKVKGPVTRAELLSTIKEVGTFDLGGITLSYGPDDNQGMDQVFLTVIRADGSFKPVDRLER